MKLHTLPTHTYSPAIVNAIIEIPKGTSIKYEYDEEYDIFVADRTLCSAMTYPANYGFIPNTLAEDKDPLDIIVYNSLPFNTGSLVECTVLGVLDMTDKNEKDWKILAAPISHIKKYDNIEDIEDTFLQVCKNFFEHYKDLTGKRVEVTDWYDKFTAHNIIEECTARVKAYSY